MHPTEKFLRLLWPVAGRKAIVAIKNKVVTHHWFDPSNTADAAAKALDLVAAGNDVYYALAGFASDERRQALVSAVKALWIDIDVGAADPNKYPTATAAASALAEFIAATALPHPIVVTSGYGLHVYWSLQRELPFEQWKPLAEKLKLLCLQHKLKIDPKCTADGARILRPIGTKNFKNGAPRIVSILNRSSITVDDSILLPILEAVNDPFASMAKAMPEGARDAQPIFESVPTADFNQILSHCATIRWAYEHQDEVSEPLWYDVLGVAGFCADASTAAHSVSKNHPGYNPRDTERKLSQRVAAAGPTTCHQFRTQAGAKCQSCPHNVTSPVLLGKPKNTVTKYHQSVSGAAAIKLYTHPDVRVVANGLEIKVPDGKPDSEGNQAYSWVRLAPHGINPMLELRLPDGAAAATNHVWFSIYSERQQEVDRFLVQAQGISNSQQFNGDCGKRGYYLEAEAVPGAYRKFHRIMRTWVAQMKAAQGPIITFRSFGWIGPDGKDQDKDAFLLGTTLFTKTGEYTTPLVPELAASQEDFTNRGTLAKWTAAMDNYNLPGMEAYMFASWCGWGAPLMTFTTTGSIMFHIVGDTGVGKSSLQRAVLSIYADFNSRQLLDVADSTNNSVGGMMGILKNLPYLREEATEKPAQELAAWSLALTHGRERGRLQSNLANAQVKTWATIALTSANASVRECIATERMDSAARLARIWEQEMEMPFTQAEANRLFGAMASNYGHAGPIYIRQNVANRDENMLRVQQMEQKLQQELNARGPDRFHLGMIAANTVGAQIAVDLGLIHHDIDRGLDYAKRQFELLRTSAASEKQTAEQTLARFIQDVQPDTMAVEVDDPNNATAFVSDANILRNVASGHGAHMRYAKSNSMFYTSIPNIRRWYAEQHMNFETDMRALERQGILVHRLTKCCLFKGTKFADGKQIMVMQFDLSKGDGLIEVAEMPE